MATALENGGDSKGRKECPFRCGETFSNQDEMEGHVSVAKGTCPLAPVVCPFSKTGKTGCTVEPQRRFQQVHLSRSSGLHQQLLLEQLTKVEERQAVMQEELDHVIATINALPAYLPEAQRNGATSESLSAPTQSEPRGQSAAPELDTRIHALETQLQDLVSSLTALKVQCSKTDQSPPLHEAHLPPSKPHCSGCDALAGDVKLLRSAVLSMASSDQKCTKWAVHVSVRMDKVGNLSLLSAPTSPYYCSGPMSCGHQVYTSSTLEDIVHVSYPRVARNQVGNVALSVNIVRSKDEWPAGTQDLEVSFPDTLRSTTTSVIVKLPSAGQGAGQRKTVHVGNIPILIPAHAELGSVVDWTYEAELCAFWTLEQA